jgi:hypothetical protein
MERKTSYIAVAFGVLLWTVVSAQGTIITFELSQEYSEAYPPESPGPWLTATIDDGGVPGSVDLTLEATALVGSEFVFDWLFNVDPALDPTLLVFSAPTKMGSFTDPTIGLGVDAFHAAGARYFDIEVAFSHTAGESVKFGAGDSVSYTITGMPGLTADAFQFSGVPGRFRDSTDVAFSFESVAHVGGIGPEGEYSGWIAVPEPSALVMLALGGVALGVRKRE